MSKTYPKMWFVPLALDVTHLYDNEFRPFTQHRATKADFMNHDSEFVKSQRLQAGFRLVDQEDPAEPFDLPDMDYSLKCGHDRSEYRGADQEAVITGTQPTGARIREEEYLVRFCGFSRKEAEILA